MNIASLIERIPKAELHVHIEGTLEPELMMTLAERNKIKLPYADVAAIREAYNFTDLQSFLDVYHIGTQVLKHEQDFYDMTWAYLERAAQDNVRHTEIFIDSQTHTDRDIKFSTMIDGIGGALRDAESKLGISSHMILCFLRHLSAEAAMATYEEARNFDGQIKAFGLASSELGHPPSKFKDVFDRVRADGYLTVAHAGEEGPPDYIWEALDLLDVKRIDHGVRCLEDEKLVQRLAEEQIPLTVCPLSNVKLCVFDSIEEHNLKELMSAGLCVTVNSDDPSYFGGYIGDNFLACQKGLDLSKEQIVALAKNSFTASFIDDATCKQHLHEIDELVNSDSE